MGVRVIWESRYIGTVQIGTVSRGSLKWLENAWDVCLCMSVWLDFLRLDFFSRVGFWDSIELGMSSSLLIGRFYSQFVWSAKCPIHSALRLIFSHFLSQITIWIFFWLHFKFYEIINKIKKILFICRMKINFIQIYFWCKKWCPNPNTQFCFNFEPCFEFAWNYFDRKDLFPLSSAKIFRSYREEFEMSKNRKFSENK